jgi:hypothetical protein
VINNLLPCIALSSFIASDNSCPPPMSHFQRQMSMKAKERRNEVTREQLMSEIRSCMVDCISIRSQSLVACRCELSNTEKIILLNFLQFVLCYNFFLLYASPSLSLSLSTTLNLIYFDLRGKKEKTENSFSLHPMPPHPTFYMQSA